MATAEYNSTYQYETSPYGMVVCYPRQHLLNNSGPNGWQSGSALASSLPFFITQLFVANLSYRILYHLTRPLYLPPFVAQILSGLLFSPTLLGNLGFFQDHVFPYRFTMVLETFANLALVYNIFLLGLEMDLSLIRLTEMKPLSFAAVGIIVPLAVGSGLYYLPGNGISGKLLSGCMYCTIVLSCTNFPDLARILADLKLLRTDIGRTAMSVAIVTDLCTWVLLIVVFSAFNKKGEANKMMPNILISIVAFILFCIYVVRPTVKLVFAKATKGGHVSDSHVWLILGGVVFCSLITDACGTHSVVGAFMFGLVIPQEHTIRNMIVEKLHDFLSGILMPLFFIISGLRADLQFMWENTTPRIMIFVICGCFSAKIVGTFIVAFFHGMPTRDSMALGLLMNTKGVLALVVLNSGRDVKAVDRHMFSFMLIVLLVMSLLVEPLLVVAYKPKKWLAHYRHRVIQSIKQEAEFRILACIHDLHNASGAINLLHVSNPTKQSPLNVFVIHLVELTGRTTASMLIMNDEHKPKINFADHVRAETDQIIEIFETMEVNNEAIMVQTVTAVSPYETMHEDICGLAEDKRVCFILLPYHKQLTADGRMGDGNASHAEINRNVLNHAPCSVGILVDRGMGIARSESRQGDAANKQVAMFFLGGPDDREALTYSWRMAGDQAIGLTVVRFVPARGALQSSMNEESTYLDEKEKQIDEECIYEFNFKTRDDSSVTYIEKVVNDGKETIGMIRDMENNNSYDLYVVGRGHGVNSPVTVGLSDWSSSPDLGTIGDTLASSNFTIHASVLVIQQYSAANRRTAAAAHDSADGQKKSWHEDEPFMKSSGKGNGHEEEEDE